MTATKKVRVDRALSTNNDSDASVASFLTVAAGAPGFNTATGVISIPNNTNQLTNGAGFITSSALSSYQTSLVSGTSIKTVNSTSLLGSGNITVQATLVSGTNIKTINGTSILGSGDITISGGGGGGASTGNITFNGSTISAAASGSFSEGAGDWSGSVWQGTMIIRLNSPTNALKTFIGSLTPGAIVVVNGSAQYTVTYTQINSSYLHIGVGSMGSGSVTSISISDTGVAFANNVLIGGSITGGASKTTAKLFDNQVRLGTKTYPDGGTGSVAVGDYAGDLGQGIGSIAIGRNAGSVMQGDNAIAIGNNAAYSSQPANSIVVNASGADLQPSQSGLYIKPIRSNATPTNIIYYNTTTGEMTYGAVPSGSSGGEGGGGGASSADYFKYQRTDMSMSPGNTLSFTLPTASGPILAIVNSGSPSANVLSVSPGQWLTPAWSGSPPMAPGFIKYYFNPNPTAGTQSAFFDNWNTSANAQVTQWVLDSSSSTQQVYLAAANCWGWQTTATIANPLIPNGWATAGYCYGSIYAPDENAWISLQSFQAAPNVTIYISTTGYPDEPVLYFRFPASVWSSGTDITLGTYTNGPWSQCYINAYFFGV